MLQLTDKWVWDFWLVRADDVYHMFFLEADRLLGDPDLRHFEQCIGRATSTDLIEWTYHGPCLGPSRTPAADDMTTWTGSVIRERGTWWMFYTGTRRAEKGKIQRVCAATSDDLVTWHKLPGNPLVELDPRWYEDYDPAFWPDGTWRDPWVVRDPEGDGFHMFLTARVRSGDPSARGCIAHARSRDLVHWEVGPPVYAGGHFGYLEVPQVCFLDGRWYCLFCTDTAHYGGEYLSRRGAAALSGTHYLVADQLAGPYRLEEETFFAGDEICSLYAGRLVSTDDGLVFLAFENRDADGGFVGRICDPIPVRVVDGRLTLER